MRLGIFAKTFARTSLGEALDAVRAHGIGCVQFNMSCAGLPTMPEEIPSVVAERIRVALDGRDLTVAAVSGTFNMIHPDPGKRRDALRRFGVLAGACGQLGTEVITLCTGTRDPEDMWRYHPENDSPDAWRDLLACMEQVVRVGEKHEVTLAFEPEANNVVASAAKGRRLLDEMRSSRLKVVIDAANLSRGGELRHVEDVLDAAFESIGDDVVIAHAKDVKSTGEVVAAGSGELDYDRYLENLRGVGFEGPLILHGLGESEVDDSVAFLRGKLAEHALCPEDETNRLSN
jgi:sugar phosphate isomerase/epimerase